MKRLICIATLLAWSSALAADGYLAITNNVMVIGLGGSGSDPNALTNNDSRAITLTNTANVFVAQSFTTATGYFGAIVITNPDNSIWIMSSNGLGTNNTFTGATNYGSAARTNWTWMDAAGWHNTNNSAASQGVDISKGKIITPNMMTPTNTPTDAYVLTATGTAGDTAWKVGGGAPWIRQVIVGGMQNSTLSAAARYLSMDAVLGISPSSTVTPVSDFAPSGGYLSNLVVYGSTQLLATTNIVFTISTNNALSGSFTGTALTCTLIGDTGVLYTNDFTHSVALPSAQLSTAWLMTVTPSVALAAQSLRWQVDWWHQ